MSGAAPASARRLDPALAAIVGEGLFSRLAFGVLGFALPLYARRLGLTLSEIGLLLSLNSAVAIALKPALAFAADRFGPKRVLVAAVALRSLVSLLLVFATAPWQLFAIRALHGLSMALRDPAAGVLIAERGGEKNVASAFAWVQTARAAAGSSSKALAGLLLGLTGSRFLVLFLAGFALSALPLVLVVRHVRELPPAPPRPQAPAAGPGPGARAPVLAVAGLGFLAAGTAEMLSGLFPVLAMEHGGLSAAQTGMVYAAGTAAGVLAGPAFGWLSDRVSRRLVLGVRGAANALSSILYAVSPTLGGIALARCLDDVGTAAFRPAWGALMAQVSGLDRSRRARIMAWLGMGEDAGGVAAPVLAGFLWNGWGIAAVMGVRLIMAAGSEIYALAVAHRLAPAQARRAELGAAPGPPLVDP